MPFVGSWISVESMVSPFHYKLNNNYDSFHLSNTLDAEMHCIEQKLRKSMRYTVKMIVILPVKDKNCYGGKLLIS